MSQESVLPKPVPARRSQRPVSVPVISIVILSAALSAWLAMLVFHADHEAGGYTQNVPAFLGGWVIMLTAMMLPSELNYAGTYSTLLKSRAESKGARLGLLAGFLSGYGVVWVAFGLVALLLDTLARNFVFAFVLDYRLGSVLAGITLVAAGLYQVSNLKEVCLNHCRTPLAYFTRFWKDGAGGAMAMGIRHGVVCVGCCWALMGVMFVVGTMNLTWMALLTVLMFAEKVLPKGKMLMAPTAVFLVGMGFWVIFWPNTAPLLSDPLVYGLSLCGSF